MKLGGALQKAIDKDDVEAIEAALAGGEEVTKTAVNHAATSNKVTALSFLLERIDEVSADALILSAQNGRFEALKCLLDAGNDPDISNPNGVTALMYASMENRPEFVELLLGAGADIDHQDSQDRGAIDLAIKYDSKDAAQTLLNRGARISNEQGAQLAKMGLDVDSEPADRDESGRDEILGRWKLDTVRYEGDFEAAGFSPERSDTESAAALGLEDNFVEFSDDGGVAGRYFHSDFTGDWKLDGDRITITRKLHEPENYGLSNDRSSMVRKDYDEEHGLDMYVTFVPND